MNAAMQMPAEAFGLNEEQQAFREAARDFADNCSTASSSFRLASIPVFQPDSRAAQP